MWTFDNAHDVLLALLVEEADRDGRVDHDWTDAWRLASSVPDLAVEFSPESSEERALLLELLSRVRSRVVEHGDFVPADLAGWSVLQGRYVSDGFVRHGVLPVGAILDVVDAIDAALRGTLPPDPEYGFWFYGGRDGRVAIDRPDWKHADEVAVGGVSGLRYRLRRALRQTK